VLGLCFLFIVVGWTRLMISEVRWGEVKQRKEMASQQHIEKMQLRQNFRNFWHTDLFTTIQADTPCKFYLSPTYSQTHHMHYSHILSPYMQIVALLSGGKFSSKCFQFFSHGSTLTCVHQISALLDPIFPQFLAGWITIIVLLSVTIWCVGVI